MSTSLSAGSERAKAEPKQHKPFADLNSITDAKLVLGDSVAVHKGPVAAAKVSQHIVAVDKVDFGMGSGCFRILQMDIAMAFAAQLSVWLANQIVGANIRTAYNQKGRQLSKTSLFQLEFWTESSVAELKFNLNGKREH